MTLWHISCVKLWHGIMLPFGRLVGTNEANIVNESFAAALSKNRNRDFWQEVKRIRCIGSLSGMLSMGSLLLLILLIYLLLTIAIYILVFMWLLFNGTTNKVEYIPVYRIIVRT